MRSDEKRYNESMTQLPTSSVKVTNLPKPQEVIGPVTNEELRAAPVPVSAAALPLPGGASTATKQDDVISQLQALNSLVPSVFDYISLGYTEDDLTTVVFKSGGVGGEVVSTLTMAYTAGVLQSVTKS